MTVLQATGLTVRRGRRAILNDADFALNRGEMIGLIGPNGAGKTTLLKAIANLIQPDAGDVQLNGNPITQLPRKEIARHIAYLAQNATFHWPMTVERIVALGRLPHLNAWQNPATEDASAVEAAMLEADVTQLRHRRVTTLSGGEAIRVLMAASLAVDAPILLADEPVSGLDPGHQLQLMQLLRNQAAQGRSVVAVLHDLTLAARYCHRLVLMSKGRIVADGTPTDVLSPDNLANVYGILAQIQGTGDTSLVIPTGLTVPRAPLDAPSEPGHG